MSTRDNLDGVLHRLYEEVWNGDDPAIAYEFVHSDYYIHDRAIADEMRGPELYVALAEMTRSIFPDMEFTIHETINEGDLLALRWTMTGTHEGQLFGLEDTGIQVDLPAIEVNRFDGGKLRETWTQSDMLGLMEQVGALPESE